MLRELTRYFGSICWEFYVSDEYQVKIGCGKEYICNYNVFKANTCFTLQTKLTSYVNIPSSKPNQTKPNLAYLVLSRTPVINSFI